jgi:hypothetical protein
VLLIGQERIQEARAAGVVGPPFGSALQQPAVLEEHVDELPQDVVGRLHQLLGDERVTDRRQQLPVGV